jgi:hypothetical protein
MREAVHKLKIEWDESLHLPGSTYWKVEGVTNPRAFFSHIPKIFPHGMTLLIEGLEVGASAKSLYQEYPAVYTKRVACDTMSPTPASFHVEFSPNFSDCLCRLIESQGLAAAFYHFKGYSEDEVVFTFHDAFRGELVLSGGLSEVAVRDFADALGCPAERAVFRVDLRKQLIALDQAINPPWWLRAWRIFRRGKNV